jgi:glycyl-tRNA synthetase beta chain
MVGEFPELQGNRGEHYALHDGELPAVAQAIADHYSPRFAGDTLPRNPVGLAVALADKLETLVGIYGIGLIPTGDKDPFALRRHALGVIRMAIEKGLQLDILQALQQASELFTNHPDFKDPSEALFGFILDRLRGYLRDQGYSAGEVESVISQRPSKLTDLIKRLEAVRVFSHMEQAESLAAANKRISNILKKNEQTTNHPFNESLLIEPAEIALASKVKSIAPQSQAAFENGDFEQSLALLASLRAEVDAFFLDVMVMDKNEALKNNRIALLTWMHGLMNRVADISQLA